MKPRPRRLSPIDWLGIYLLGSVGLLVAFVVILAFWPSSLPLGIVLVVGVGFLVAKWVGARAN